MSYTKIEWATQVWNPFTGCTHGCTFCYARRFALRMKHNTRRGIARKYRNGFVPTAHMEEMYKPATWRTPQRVFVGSMGDLFDPYFPDVYRAILFAEMAKWEGKHIFILLTKRPDVMLRFMPLLSRVLTNVWLGVSPTTQAEADRMIPLLLDTPAAKRLVSIEPMFGPIDLRSLKGNAGSRYQVLQPVEAGDSSRPAIDWVICGGETGPGAMPMHPDWVRSLRDQCAQYNVPFFFKNWGALKQSETGEMVKNTDHCNTLDGVQHTAIPEGGQQ